MVFKAYQRALTVEKHHTIRVIGKNFKAYQNNKKRA
jgi:hypothetical protein